MSDYAELIAAAKNADERMSNQEWWNKEHLEIQINHIDAAFIAVAKPKTILAVFAENAKMREALKPFADEASQYDLNDDDRICDDEEMTNGSDFSVGELRRARAAIGKGK